MLLQLVRVDAVAAVPWRNGGGVTRELLAWPDPRDWLLRVSVAEISASGPFSQLPRRRSLVRRARWRWRPARVPRAMRPSI